MKKAQKQDSTIYIDQSGKVEYTSKNTVIAFSNGKQKSILIKAKDKREVQRLFRDAGKPEVFVLKTFSALVYLLIKDDLTHFPNIVIDREYWGKESIIKDFLLRIIRSRGHQSFDSEKITFDLVGRKRNCHILAISVYKGTIKADTTAKSGDILKLVL